MYSLQGSQSSQQPISREMEIRHLSLRARNQLALFLDCNDSWKELAAIIHHPDLQDKLFFSTNDISMLEEEGSKRSRSPTQALIQVWSTTGKNRPTIKLFLKLLISAGLLRAANYLSVDILGEGPLKMEELFDSEGDNTQKFDDNFQVPAVVLPANRESANATPHVFDKDGREVPLQSLHHYAYATLENATLNFVRRKHTDGGRLLGEGAFGTVYLGYLTSNEPVAIKRLKDKVGQQFVTELKVLTRFTHPNLLPLLGYSVDGPSACLVYEFLAKGSLEHCLSQKENSPQWQQRVLIATGTARGINHLHTFEEKPLVHRDIKSANILLDANLLPKVGDFGLVHLGSLGSAGSISTSVVATTVSGTSPYMAPEAFRGDVSAKMDTFSFGVVLLELLTSLPPYDPSRQDVDLLSHIQEICECGEISELLDKNAGLWNMQAAKTMYDLSVACTKDRKRERPTMVEVLLVLEELSVTII